MKKLLIFISMLVLLSIGVSAGNVSWSDNSSTLTNSSIYEDMIDFQITYTGKNPPNILNMLFSWNGSNGVALENDTKVFKNTTSATLAVSKKLNLTEGTFCWSFWANDTNGKWNNSDVWCHAIYQKTLNLSWSNNITGVSYYSRKNENLTFNVTFNTYMPTIVNISSTIFSWNGSNGGALENESANTVGSKSTYNYGISMLLNLTAGKKFCWKFYVNDTNNLWSSTDTWCHTMYNYPSITMNIPSTNTNFSTASIAPNISVTGASSYYNCDFYSNDTGTMTEEGSPVTLANGVSGVFPNKTVSEGSVMWNVKCFEQGHDLGWSWGTNTTFTVDLTAPVVSINELIDGTGAHISSTKHYLRTLNFTPNVSVTELWLKNCSYYLSDSTNGTALLNQTNTTSKFNTSYLGNSLGIYNFYVTCDDYVGKRGTSDTYYFTVDIINPFLNSSVAFANYSLKSCTAFGLNISASESLDNSTILYGNTTNLSNRETYFTDGRTRIHTIVFNKEWETMYSINFSLTDLAGNVNDSIFTLKQTTPVPLCAGWNIYTVYNEEPISSLKTHANSSYVYWWNNSGQAWVYSDATRLKRGYAAYFYAPDDTTWFRNASHADIGYQTNLSSGHNYLGIGYPTYFNTTLNVQFKNDSLGNITPQLLEFRIDYISAWNNTGKNWVSSMYGMKWRNETAVGRTVSNGLDAVWIWSNYNLSINVTKLGTIYGNWS